MLHRFDYLKLLFLSTLVFAYCKWQQFSHSSIPGTYTLGVRRTPNQTDSDLTFPDRAIKRKWQQSFER